MTYIANRDYNLEIAKGNVADHQLLSIVGYNTDIDTASAEDVWPNGGDFVPPTEARLHNIVSGSANDTSAGTGARTVEIKGIGSSGEETVETVTMNGTSNVATTLTFLAINSMQVLTSGTGLVNAGIITATAQTDSTVTATIPAGIGKSASSVYRVPQWCRAYLQSWRVSVSAIDSTTSEAEVGLFAKPDGGSWGLVGRMSVTANNMTGEEQDFRFSQTFGAGTTLKARVLAVSSDNVDVTAHIVGVLLKSEPLQASRLLEDGGYRLLETGGARLLEN